MVCVSWWSKLYNPRIETFGALCAILEFGREVEAEVLVLAAVGVVSGLYGN